MVTTHFWAINNECAVNSEQTLGVLNLAKTARPSQDEELEPRVVAPDTSGTPLQVLPLPQRDVQDQAKKKPGRFDQCEDRFLLFPGDLFFFDLVDFVDSGTEW